MNHRSLKTWLLAQIVLPFFGQACSKENSNSVPQNNSTLALGPTIGAEDISADPFANTNIVSCALYQEQRCENKTQQTCSVFDTKNKTFNTKLDPLYRRVLLYDRWYDLYNSPSSTAAQRLFSEPVDGGLENESTWGSMDKFAGFAGVNDGSIWTGAALTAAIFRYASTGTNADYERMERMTRALLLNFDVTGYPGYLARYYYMQVPEGTPLLSNILMRTDKAGQRDNPILNPDTIDGLPTEYIDGVPDGKGGIVRGIPMWNGHPSIDQYTGPMMAFPIAYDLIRDPSLKARMVEHLTCYFKRLQRLEIINLGRNPALQEELSQLFAGAGVDRDENDIDLSGLDNFVVYYLRGINKTNIDDYPVACPDKISTTTVRTLDASDPDAFLLELLELLADMNDTSDNDRSEQIDHFYVPNVRGADASHLLHLAAMSYYFTQEQQYLDFFYKELIESLNALAMVDSMRLFSPPVWCYNYYPDHISYTTHWQFITMLQDTELRARMVGAMREEYWLKAMNIYRNAHFNVLYGSVTNSTVEPDRDSLIEDAMTLLSQVGALGSNIDEPRRPRSLTRAEAVDAMPEGTTLWCPTNAERAACEGESRLMGLPLGAKPISYTCDDRAGECIMSDGKCVEGLASMGLPPTQRPYADFMWQRNPFQLGDPIRTPGTRQSPGIDLSEPYWMARHYGMTNSGENKVLAWADSGSCIE